MMKNKKEKSILIICKYLLADKFKAVFLLLITILNAALNVGMAAITYSIIEVAQKGTVSDVVKLLLFTIIYLILYAVMSYAEINTKNAVVQNAMKNLKQDVIHSIMNQNYDEFSNYGFSNYYAMMTQDMEMIESSLFNDLIDFISYGSGFIIAVMSMLYMNIFVTIWVFFMTFVVLKLPAITSEKYKRETAKMSEMNAAANASIKDTIYSYGFTRNVESRKNIILKAKSTIAENCNQKINLLRIKKLTGIISNTSAWGTTFTTSIICAFFVVIGRMSISSMMGFAQLMNNVSYPLVAMSETINGVKSLKPITAKLCTILENNEVRQERKIQFHSNIQFQDVSFAYADNQVLQHLSVTIEKGKKYLVIGSSGCGKSTFLKLIARYYDCQSGTISIDQENIKNYSSSEIDEIMTIMNQNVYMMNDTLKNNITLLNDNYDEQELKKVISICGLNDLVQRLPNKENELIIEDGNNFSGGEKQRIALARTIIRKTPILLLDEFSSALDETNSIDIERIILEMKEITLINVSHKINSINLAQYDSVLYFNNKSCIEMAVDEENICKIEQLKEKME